MKKGQTAMEYLMTYGWAILIVIIVAGALYALGVFNPATYSAAKASGFPNIGIPATGSWVLKAAAANDQFQLALKNNIPAKINITAVSVTVGTTSCTNAVVNVDGMDYTPGSDDISLAIGKAFTIKANCGTQTAGSAYTASVEITYDNLDTGISGLVERGTVMGTVS